jgi:subtilisin family serine protease
MISPQQFVGLSNAYHSLPFNSPLIGLIDGPVASTHPDFVAGSIVQAGNKQAVCQSANSPACVHGTFVAGVLTASRSSQFPGIVPEAKLISRSLFCEASDLNQCPVVTPQHLADAVTDLVNSNVRVINLSLGLAQPSLGNYNELHEAFDLAQRRGVLVVGAGGNQGRVGHNPLFDHTWVIPVSACDLQGKIIPSSNMGKSIGQRGLLAPGLNIEGLFAPGGYTRLSGTSIATPFVSGAIARLWGEYPHAQAQQIREALLLPNTSRKGIIPPVLNVQQSRQVLGRQFSSVGNVPVNAN